jgi:hypothetical protein
MITERRLPHGAASPIGKRFSGQNLEASQAPGILKVTMEIEL